jgi:mannose-1-phosphate guanylyltransferase
LDLTKAVKWHKEKGAIATVIMKSVPKEEVSSYGVIVTDEDGRVKAFQEKPPVEEAISTDINTGIYIFEPEVLNYIPSGQEYDIGGELFPKLVEMGAPFYGISMISNGWILAKFRTIGERCVGCCSERLRMYPFPDRKLLLVSIRA